MLLAGCALSPEYRARMQAQAAARQQAQDDDDDAFCRSHGIVPGYPQYLQCRQMLVGNRQAEEAARQQASIAMMGAGLEMMSRPVPPPPPTDDHVCIAQNNTLYRC